jgi:hypothetical protein
VYPVLALIHALEYCYLIINIIFLERYSFDSISSLLVLWMNNLGTCYYPIEYCGRGLCRAVDIISWLHFYKFDIYLYWCHDCERIVPVTVQVSEFSNGNDAWSEQGTDDGSFGATHASKLSCRVSAG